MRSGLPRLFLFACAAIVVYAQRNVALPPFVSLPAETIVPPNGRSAQSVRETYGEVEFSKPAGLQRGEHWRANILYPPEALVAKAKGTDVFAKLSPALLAGGWTIAVSNPTSNPFSALLHYKKDREAWLNLQIFNPADIRADLIIVGPQPMTFSMKAPAAVAPPINGKSGDFPELPPLPDSKFQSSAVRPGAMRVSIRSASGKREDTVVASGSIVKSYSKPDLSTIQFVSAYLPALQTAGWTIIESSQGLHQTDATITAHFGNNGRNMWAYMHHTGAGYDIEFGEDAADALTREFTKSCHVVLNGVLFDFDKATLRPESDAILARAVVLIQGAKGAPIEVQGHTDGVGADDYNQKLSEARAASVVAWLTAHQVPAAQLKSKGYGKTRPVADNNSDEGRAKNRRVELSRPDCAK